MKLSTRPSRTAGLVGRAGCAGMAGAAVLVLTSCSGTAPGVAAEVEGTRITDQQVDDFAEVLCGIGIGGAEGTEAGVPSKTARFTSLQILLSNQLAEEFADVDAVSQDQVSAILESMAAAGEVLDDDLAETFEEVATEFARAQTAIVELGRESLEEAGTPPGQLTDDAAFTEGQQLIAEEAADADVEVDPRFGDFVDGTLQPGDGSVSVPASELAVAGANPEAGDELASLLPASQKCAPLS